jgi:glutamyl-tRNA reductase
LRGAQANLDELRVYTWETASLTPTDLQVLETEIASLLEWTKGIPIVTCQRYELVTMSSVGSEVSPQSYWGAEALKHLSSLAAGLESMVLGEAEILGQVRSAFSAAPSELRQLIVPAIAAARTLRAEASFNRHAGHALDLAVEHLNLEPEGSLLVVGGGPMGRRVAERAQALGFITTLVARRPLSLPPEIHYKPFSALGELPATDVIVSCLGRGAPQMGQANLPPVRRQAIDLGTPRNLTDDFEVPVLTLANLLTVQRDSGDALQRRQLETRLRELLDSRLALDAPSPLGSLREEVELIRQRELIRTMRLHPDLPPEKLDTITRTLVNQIFHRPSRRLRQSGDTTLATTLVDLFKDPSEEEPA